MRYGAAAAQKQLPYASLLAATNRNTQWQQDGWTLPFWGAAFQRYVLYMVRDNHSRKILGYSIAESENTTLITEGMEDAIRNTGVFPFELVSDKHSFHKTEVASRLRMETERMGATWTVTINAQRNQLAERYNQYLDAICKDFEGYLGKNITATSKDARPSPEALQQLAKTANFKSRDEIKAIADYIVLEFNKTPLSVLEGKSPNEAYEQSETVRAFNITEAERVALFRPVESYKVTRGQITIRVGMKRHEFQLSAELITRYNNRKLNVVYEDLTQGIYISDVATGEELGCVAPKRKIHGAIGDQTDYDREQLNKLAGRTKGVTIKARKQAHANIAESLKHNPEAIELINSYSLPKDIRALAAQNNELKKAMANHDTNAAMLPVRGYKPVQLEPLHTKAPVNKKTRETPFGGIVAPMDFISTEDFLNQMQ
jgi:transposase InsO family protein